MVTSPMRRDSIFRISSLTKPGAGGAGSAVPAFPDGGAGLVSTAEDYFAFSRLILRGGTVGNRRLLSHDTDSLSLARRPIFSVQRLTRR
jgi:CubicO group peptidase (beta-lactamase class C family)